MQSCQGWENRLHPIEQHCSGFSWLHPNFFDYFLNKRCLCENRYSEKLVRNGKASSWVIFAVRTAGKKICFHSKTHRCRSSFHDCIFLNIFENKIYLYNHIVMDDIRGWAFGEGRHLIRALILFQSCWIRKPVIMYCHIFFTLSYMDNKLWARK